VADGLLRLHYGAFPPVRIEASPLLATTEVDGRPADELVRLLRIRTAQALEARSTQTRVGLEARRDEEEARHARRRTSRSAAPTILRRGTWRTLGAGSGRHRVSVLLPVKNGARDLREQLPLLFGQRADAELELVAVDSGSRDDSVDVLADAGATILSIDPASFDHGLTRNLAAEHASGDVLVLLTHRSRPVGTDWLAPLLAALDADPSVAGACSRVTPHPHADPLTRRDGLLDPSGSPVRAVKRITDWDAYRHAPPEERRLLLNFHTVSAALRADVVARIPFRQVRTIGEDLLWARDVLEAGLALTHEPASHAYHSHDYSLRERFMRNVDDGVANHDIAGRELPEEAVAPMIRAMVAEDWAQLRGPLGLEGAELEDLQVEAVLRRVAQVAGQWVGANHESLPPEVLDAFSRVATMRRAT
jgi:rhamnosyltransferase